MENFKFWLSPSYQQSSPKEAATVIHKAKFWSSLLPKEGRSHNRLYYLGYYLYLFFAFMVFLRFLEYLGGTPNMLSVFNGAASFLLVSASELRYNYYAGIYVLYIPFFVYWLFMAVTKTYSGVYEEMAIIRPNSPITYLFRVIALVGLMLGMSVTVSGVSLFTATRVSDVANPFSSTAHFIQNCTVESIVKSFNGDFHKELECGGDYFAGYKGMPNPLMYVPKALNSQHYKAVR